MTTRIRRPGEFCWINILTPQPAEAREFFTTLFGWSYVEIPGMGHRVQVGGRDIGGLFDLAAPNTPPGLPPGIGVMVKVESADATCEKVRSLGGTAKPPFDIGEQGRMAECADPNGAMFDLWEARKSPGMDADGSEHGVPGWFETLTTDARRAEAFYTALFGWKTESMHVPNGTYTSFRLGDTPVGGMLQITPDMGAIPPHWSVYFTVNNADQTMAEAITLGGKIWMPPLDIPNIGRIAGLASPQGVHFYVITYRAGAGD